MAIVAAIRGHLARVPTGVARTGLGDGQCALVLVQVDPLAGVSVNNLALVVPVDLKKRNLYNYNSPDKTRT